MRYCIWLQATTLAAVSYARSTPICIDAFDRFGNRCGSRLRLVSFYAAVKTYCKDDDVVIAEKSLSEECNKHNKTLIPISNLAQNLTQDAIQQLRLIEHLEVAKDEELSEPILVSRNFYDLAHRTINTWEYVEHLHWLYGFLSIGFWILVVCTGVLYRLAVKKREQRASFDNGHEEVEPKIRLSQSVLQRIHHHIRTHFILPAGWNSYHLRLYYGCTIPTRIESIIVALFWIMSITFCVIRYPAFEGNLYWEKVDRQVGRYLADRTGILSYANLTLLWLFSGRNNVLQWATGWSFSSFNIYHRHIARVSTLQAIVHSITYHHLIVSDFGYKLYHTWLTKPWFYYGIFGTILMSTLLLFSSIYLRMYHYEFFLFIHIAFSLGIIVALFTHTSIFEREYDIFLWPPALIWLFDRFLRIVKLAHCNLSMPGNKRIIPIAKSQVTYSTESNVIRVHLTTESKVFHPKPGQHYFIYAPFAFFGWRAWENHPFTIAAWDHAEDDKTSQSTQRRADQQFTRSRSNSVDSDVPMLPQDQSSQSLVFYIRPFDGFTRRIRHMCLKHPNHQAYIRLLLEGPYGHSAPLHQFETLLLIAGGTGIAGALPHIRAHLDQDTTRQDALIQRIVLIWTTQQPAFIEEVAEAELKSAFGHKDIQMSFFATRSNHALTNSLNEDAPTEPISLSIQHRRPDVSAEIQKVTSEYGSTGLNSGKIGVLVCGPGGMADNARATVCQIMKTGVRNIEYFEDAYGW